MADSPLITAELREYIQRFKIEEIVTSAINSLAHKLPSDPFTFLAGFFADLSEEPPSVSEIRAREVLLETRPSLEVVIECQSKGQIFPAPAFVFSPGQDEGNYALDNDRMDGKGMRNAARMAENLKSILYEQDIANQRKIDNLLSKEPGINSNVLVSVSFACAIAAAFFKKVPVYKHIFEKYTRREWDTGPFPKLMLPLLFTGKANGSKVKFSRFIIYEAHAEKISPHALMDGTKKIYDTIRKILASGKGGESGLRLSHSGFIPLAENINECLKIIEDTMNQSGFSLGEDFLVAIDCNAEEYYLKDLQKYEMEGFKAPPDVTQLTEFYAKLMNDKAYIGMLIDPFVAEDLHSWKNLAARVPNKRLASVKMGRDIEKLRAHTENEETKAELWLPSAVSFHYSYQVTNLIDLAKVLTKNNCNMIITEHQFESLDTTLIDLAVGLKAEFLQMSAPVKSPAFAKFNRIIQLRT